MLIVCLLLIAPVSFAQGSKADYQRAAELPARFRNKVIGRALEPVWMLGGKSIWYRDSEDNWFAIDTRTGTTKPAFNRESLIKALSEKLGNAIDKTNLRMERLRLKDEKTLYFTRHKVAWIFRLDTNELAFSEWDKSPLPFEKRKNERRKKERWHKWTSPQSPDKQWKIKLEDNNIALQRLNDSGERLGDPINLTVDGTAKDGYTNQFYWSPDSKKLVVIKRKAGDERRVTIIDSAPDKQFQPRTDSYFYLKPGDRVPIDRPTLFDITTQKKIELSHDLAPNPFGIQGVRWKRDGSAFTYEYNQRGHQVYRVIEVNAKTGESRAIISEEPKTFFCYSRNMFLHYLDDTDELLWLSERDGWNHLYLYDWKTGQVKRQVTKGQWVVREIDRVDEKTRTVWFWAGGIYKCQDPYYLQYCRANLDTGAVTPLTLSNGTHTAISVSPDGKTLVTTWSRVDHPPVHELRSAETGKLIKEIARADASALVQAGWVAPKRFVAKGRDGKTDIYGIIIKPTNFDPSKKYPVIEQIYAGPHGAHVPKKFYGMHRNMQLAELGFIVVQIDGMGTNWRGKAFHDVAWKNLKDAGLPDRIAWMKAAAKTRPWMDLSRVGVYGGSAGGQNAMRAVLDHADFYKAAAADCGCHDNRMDKIWWNEQWMGWPVDESYIASSNSEDAHKLGGKLLLTVGELDRNVDPASTMQVVDALIKANKDFELMVFPGKGHGAGESGYGTRLRADFFVRHLLGKTPRWE